MIHLIIITSLTLFYLFSCYFESKKREKKEIVIPSFTPEKDNTKEAENIKRYLDTQLKEKLGFEIDKEKAIAIAKIDKNLLLQSGAGSGKTTAIAYKIFYLIRKENINPKEIVVLAFNREAAKKLRIKTRKDFDLKEFQNSRTFHSLAYQIVKPKNKILFGSEMFKVIEKIIREEVVRKSNMTDSQITEITELFIQFIQRAKKSEMTSNDIQEEIKINYSSNRIYSFLSFANEVYKQYEEYLVTTNRMDFDDLLNKATEMVYKSRGECAINITKDKRIKMNDLKYIFIDEFQDFSDLFYNLIYVIKKYNKNLKLWCVGDSNQAINGFAGSNLKYFNNFSKYFDNIGISNLSTNYRSKKVIVDASNRLMAGEEKQYFCHSSPENNKGGQIIIQYAQKDSNGSFLQGYLELCLELIINNPNKSIAILYRKNEIEGMNLSAFYKQLEGLLGKKESKRIEVSTIHKFKGREANIVIILQVCRKMFPLIHPHNVLFRIFGWSQDDILSEETRIFYVSITRAKEKIYLLTEAGNESKYIKFLME